MENISVLQEILRQLEYANDNEDWTSVGECISILKEELGIAEVYDEEYDEEY
jgi:hypothetical protein